MLEEALKSRLPMVVVTTDDPVNVAKVLRHYAGRPVMELTNASGVGSQSVYWTEDERWATADNYRKFSKVGTTLVLVNLDPPPFAFNAGYLQVPDDLLAGYLADLIDQPTAVPELAGLLRGLSFKTAEEILKLTEARTGSLLPHEVRRTRSMVAPATRGLSLLDTELDFYDWPQPVQNWVVLNKPYFLGNAHHKLTPRGLLFEGPPGTGKSTAAKAIADQFKVPLYRLDIASTLNKYIGVSEEQMLQALSMVDREAPCVLLIDEVEKIFGPKDDNGVTARMLSTLLWWLAEHQSKVFTVMTTNDITTLPPELYRPGRIDRVFKLDKLLVPSARVFARHVLESVLPDPTANQYGKVNAIDFKGPIAHADVAERVYDLIKTMGWGLDKTPAHVQHAATTME